MKKSTQRKAGAAQLGSYVARVMKLKALLPAEVAARAGSKITTTYVNAILKGTSRDPSAMQLKALAEGLGVGADELFRVAACLSTSHSDAVESVDPSHTLMFLDLMMKAAVDPNVTGILKEVLLLSPEERAVVLKTIKALVNADSRSSSGAGSS